MRRCAPRSVWTWAGNEGKGTAAGLHRSLYPIGATHSATGITSSSMKTLLLLLLTPGVALASPSPPVRTWRGFHGPAYLSQLARRPSQHVLDSIANAAALLLASCATERYALAIDAKVDSALVAAGIPPLSVY